MARSVLIVEDELRFREAFARAVRGADDLCLAGVADNLSNGLLLLDSLEPDVLLVDLSLPGGSAIELIRRAVERLRQCESMVVTIFGHDDSVLHWIQAGATGYLLKDAREIDIIQQIRLLCSGGSPISPAIARRLLARVGGRACLQVVSDPSSRVLVAAGADGADDEYQRLQLRRDGGLDGRVAPYRCDLCQAHLPEASGRLQDGGGL